MEESNDTVSQKLLDGEHKGTPQLPLSYQVPLCLKRKMKNYTWRGEEEPHEFYPWSAIITRFPTECQ